MTQESTTRPSEFSTALDRYRPDFDLARPAGTATLAAWFLGPKAENADLLGELLAKAVGVHCDDRRGFYPNDPAYVTEERRGSAEFKASAETMYEEVTKVLNSLKGSVPFFSYRYQAHLNWDTTIPSIVGYFAAMLYNANNVAVETAPVTSLMERAVGEDLCRMLGYDPAAPTIRPWGHVTCDGSVANLEALWSARNLRYHPIAVAEAIRAEPALAAAREITVAPPDGETTRRLADLDTWALVNLGVDETLELTRRVAEAVAVDLDQVDRLIAGYSVQNLGQAEFSRRYLHGRVGDPLVLAPATRHYSWPKAMALLGLGQDNLASIKVDLDARARMDDRRRVLAEAIRSKRPVLLDVAVLGSTEQSAIDPLAEMVATRRELHHQNVSYPIHADAAWGGYFASLLRPAADRPAGEDGLRFTPEMVLSQYATTQYRALPRADSITVDPHSTGYVPYPAGALCYRNGEQRGLVAPHLSHGETGQNLGVFGVEGARPGAAAAGVYLSHRVIRADQGGYGKILGQSMFNGKRLYAAIMTMVDEDDEFIVAGCQRLPAERDTHVDPSQIERQRRFIRERIVRVPNERLLADPEAMALFRQLGSEQLIIGYAFNIRIGGVLNRNIQALNLFNQKISRKLRMPPESVRPAALPDHATPPLVLSESRIDPSRYGPEYLTDFQRRLGVDTDPGLATTFLTSTTMDPWLSDTATGDFTPRLVQELRKVVVDTLKEVR